MKFAFQPLRGLRLLWLLAALACVVGGCGKRVPPKVVVYTSVAREITLPLFAEFTKATGIRVVTVAGEPPAGSATLAQQIVAEREHPRCDLYWNDEILQTLALDRADLLRPHATAATNALPTAARSPRGTWFALASQARVLVVNTNQVAEARRPESISDLSDPQWYERTAIVRPLAGLSAVHAACLFQTLGAEKASELFRNIKRNARILPTDRDVAHAVAQGHVAFGLTNSSDAIVELAAGAPVTIVYPDQAADQFGTLFIPQTVALVKDSPHPDSAAALLDYLLSAAAAKQLAASPAALIPACPGVDASDRVKTPAQVRAMPADFPAASDQWEVTAKTLSEMFAAP